MSTKPTEVQEWLLVRMADFGWKIRETAEQIALYDRHRDIRRPVTRRTLDPLIDAGWIEADPEGANQWRISERGRWAILSSGYRGILRTVKAS